MKISVPKERRPHERRVAASPDTVKRLVGMGHEVVVESRRRRRRVLHRRRLSAPRAPRIAARCGGGARRGRHRAQGAAAAARGAARRLKRGAVLIGMLAPLQHPEDVPAYAEAGRHRLRHGAGAAHHPRPVDGRAVARRPISPATASCSRRRPRSAARLPMMMTAAGTIAPARVLVMGAGVAGLQAIATARRLGAIVSATDVRFAAKEQVESLGATFLAVDLEAMKAMETAGGYAKEMGEDFARRQREHVARGAEEDRHRHLHRAGPRAAARRC